MYQAHILYICFWLLPFAFQTSKLGSKKASRLHKASHALQYYRQQLLPWEPLQHVTAYFDEGLLPHGQGRGASVPLESPTTPLARMTFNCSIEVELWLFYIHSYQKGTLWRLQSFNVFKAHVQELLNMVFKQLYFFVEHLQRNMFKRHLYKNIIQHYHFGKGVSNSVLLGSGG